MNKSSQKGAILVTSLLLLLVLTIIGVSAMQMTRMQERMAGNTRDINLAFQGAESALRTGETQLQTLSARPSFCASMPCGTVYDQDVLPAMNLQSKNFWDTNAKAVTDANLTEALGEEPRYASEMLASVCWTAEFVCEGGRDFYQVSARSTGGTGDAESIVQSTFARVAN